MSRQYEFDHHLPGLAIVLGVVTVAAGAVLPWVEATTSKVGIDIKIFRTETQVKRTLGGFDKGAEGILAIIIVAALVAVLAAVALIATQRSRGLVWRFIALPCGLAVAALGVYFLAAAKQDFGELFSVLSNVGLTSVKSGLGAYLLAAGGLLMSIGAIIPGRRTHVTSAA